MTKKFPSQLTDLPEYELILVSRDKLVVDFSYQRPQQATHIRRIADAFEGIKFRPLMGNKRSDGTVALVDGYQRSSVLTLLGYEGLVPVIVPKESKTVEEEAVMFLAMNMDAKPVRAIDAFGAQVTANNPYAIQINEVLEPLGLSVNKSHKDMSISAAGCLRSVIVDCGGLANGVGQKTLKTALQALVVAYGGIYESLSASMVRGVATVVCKLDEKYLDEDILAQVLEDLDPKEWLATANGNQKVHLAVSSAMLEAYALVYSSTYQTQLTSEELCS